MTEPDSIYAQLSAKFEQTHFRQGGSGVQLEYITGEQCQDRLNQVLGYDGWSFRVLSHGRDDEANEYWTLGELTVHAAAGPVVRQQFGSQKIKRPRNGGPPLDIGFDLKGATTDALKRCAVGIGVALYLYEKDEPRAQEPPAARAVRTVYCAEPGCGQALRGVKRANGSVWTADQLAAEGGAQFGVPLCAQHFAAHLRAEPEPGSTDEAWAATSPLAR